MNTPGNVPSGSPARRALRWSPGLVLWLVFLFAACGTFIALGTWQVERRAWKLDLIQRVEARVHAAPVTAPAEPAWPDVNAADDEYRHVQVRGSYLAGHDTLVQASTELGSGYWVLTPLRRDDDGSLVLINRGFVPPAQRNGPIPLPEGRVTVTGLLRLTEPGGGFLRDNDPQAGRWYSRDVAAIAEVAALARVAPYFIDAGGHEASGTAEAPVPGLTVVRFHNSHLVYTITWYALALMSAGAALLLLRDARRH